MRKGNHEEAKKYCMKEDTRVEGPWTVGDDSKIPVKKGQRNDILGVKRAIDEGKTEKEIATNDEFFGSWVRNYRGFNRYTMMVQGKRASDTPCHTSVYWGAPGTGKTRRAAFEAGESVFWLTKPGGNVLWWDGYTGQECVVIDEFYGWIPFDTLCRILDRYPYQVECKGGTINFTTKRFIITSNVAPEQWYPKLTDVRREALLRRLRGDNGVVVEMPGPHCWTPPADVVADPPAVVDAEPEPEPRD